MKYVRLVIEPKWRTGKKILFHLLSTQRKRRQNSQRLMLILMQARRRLYSKALLLYVFVYSRSVSEFLKRIRRSRRVLRQRGWWQMVWTEYYDERFKATFRISRATFQYILEKIRADIECEGINLIEEPISPECRMAIALYRMGRGDYLYTILELCGCGVATVCNIKLQVSKAIVKNLWEDHVSVHFLKPKLNLRKRQLTWKSCGNFHLHLLQLMDLTSQ